MCAGNKLYLIYTYCIKREECNRKEKNAVVSLTVVNKDAIIQVYANQLARNHQI